MSVAITQQIPLLTPANSDVVMTVSSSLVLTKSKYKYVSDIFTQELTYLNPGPKYNYLYHRTILL